MKNEVKVMHIHTYAHYTRQVYIVKYLTWRWKKVRYMQLDSAKTHNWKKEISDILKGVRILEKMLFEDIEPYALEMLMKTDGRTLRSQTTRLSLRGITWTNDYRIVKISPEDLEADLKSSVDDS